MSNKSNNELFSLLAYKRNNKSYKSQLGITIYSVDLNMHSHVM